MPTLRHLLMIIAAVLFGAAALGFSGGSINLVALGLCLLVIAMMVEQKS